MLFYLFIFVSFRKRFHLSHSVQDIYHIQTFLCVLLYFDYFFFTKIFFFKKKILLLLTQVDLINSSPTEEEGDLYMFQMKQHTNTDGLRVYVGGQSLTGPIMFPHFPFGSFQLVIEVYRGPHVFDYTQQPLEFIWSSGCQDDFIVSFIKLRPSFLKMCAKVEFHHDNQTFALTSASYV